MGILHVDGMGAVEGNLTRDDDCTFATFYKRCLGFQTGHGLISRNYGGVVGVAPWCGVCNSVCPCNCVDAQHEWYRCHGEGPGHVPGKSVFKCS